MKACLRDGCDAERRRRSRLCLNHHLQRGRQYGRQDTYNRHRIYFRRCRKGAEFPRWPLFMSKTVAIACGVSLYHPTTWNPNYWFLPDPEVLGWANRNPGTASQLTRPIHVFTADQAWLSWTNSARGRKNERLRQMEGQFLDRESFVRMLNLARDVVIFKLGCPIQRAITERRGLSSAVAFPPRNSKETRKNV